MTIFSRFMNQICFFVGFTLLPIGLLVALSWFSYSFAHDLIYERAWANIFLLLLSTFVAGVISRQLMNLKFIGDQGMGLFIVFMLAQITFAYLMFQDLQMEEGLFSIYLPLPLNISVLPFIYSIPLVGMIGMVLSKTFSFEKD